MNLRRLKTVAKKELLHIVRDVRSLTLALALPLVMLLLFGYALTLDVDQHSHLYLRSGPHASKPGADRSISRFDIFPDSGLGQRLQSRAARDR